MGGMGIHRTFIAVLVVCGAVSVFVGGAIAGPKDTECAGPLFGPIPGNVIAIGPCDLSGVTTVGGDVKVRPGASLSANGPDSLSPDIAGKLESSKADFIDLESGQVHGDVKIEGTRNQTVFFNVHMYRNLEIHKSTALILVQFDTIDGKARLHDNRGNLGGDALVQLGESTVGGDVEVRKNVLDGANTNRLTVANGDQSVTGSGLGHDLDVSDNELVGADNTFDLTFNDVYGGNADIHGNELTGGTNSFDVGSNNVGHDLNVDDNRVSAGDIDVENNQAGRQIDCHGNRPPAISTTPNYAPKAKNKEFCVVLPGLRP